MLPKAVKAKKMVTEDPEHKMLFLCVLLSLSACVSATEQDDAVVCGGQVNFTTGQIVITDTTGAINQTCTWVIKNNKKPYQMSLDLNIESVNNNLLEVYDGKYDPKNILMNYTLESGLVWVVALSNITTIRFVRTVNTTNQNITINYDSTNCTRSLSTESSPRSPVYLPNRGEVTCYYNINQTTTVPGYTTVLSFLTFNLPDGELTYNTDNFTGTSLPSDIFSTTGTYDLKLYLKNSTKFQTFTSYLTQSLTECSMSVEVNSTATDYEVPIPEYLHTLAAECRLIFTSKNQKPLMVDLTNIDILDSDRLYLTDGGSQSDNNLVSGGNTITGRKVLTKGDNLWLRLVMDSLPHKRAVKLQLSETVSGGRFYKEGEITIGVSKADETTTNGSDYYYQLVGTNQIEVILKQANITGTIEFYNGFVSPQLITVFGSDTSFYPITSSGGELLIIARNFTAESVSATFKSVTASCNVDTSDTKGDYSLTKLADGQKQCQWTISPKSTDNVISFTINHIILRVNDTLSVSSISSSPTILAEFTGPTELTFIPSISIPATQRTRLLFTSKYNCSENCTQPLISADYTSTEVCLRKLNHPSGILSSPNWPNVYPLNSQCVWLDSESSDGNSTSNLLYMSFTTLDIPYNHSLSITSMLNSTQQTNITLTDSRLPDDIIAKGDNYMITFSSITDKLQAEVGKGFYANYRFLDCGGYFNQSKSTIQTPGYPKSYNKSSICVWRIELPQQVKKDNTTTIVQVSLKINSKKNKTGNLLEIHDGGSVRDPVIILNNTATSNNTVFMSRTHQLLILLNTTKAPNLTFTLNYTTYECKQLCDNGVCLQQSWRCNGVDECGDNTDEHHCVYPIPPTTPAPHTDSGSSGVSGYWVAVCLILGIVLGALGAVFGPHLYKRLRFPNYSHLRESNNPIA